MVKKAGRPSKPILIPALAVALSVATARLLSAQDGASGALTLNGSRIALKYAYAATEPGFFDKTSEDIHLLFSDAVLTDEDRSSFSRLSRLAREGQATIVEVVIDAKGEPLTGAIYAKPFNGLASLSGMHRFERRRFDRSGVAGRMFMQAPGDFAGVRYQYDVEFAVTIPRPPTAEEVARALASPPGLAAAAYLNTIRRGSFDAFVKALTADASADYRGTQGAAKFAEFRREMPRDAAVVGLTMKSETLAMATIQGHENARVIEYIFTLILEGGTWKVGK